jgi:hypothetical protein
LEPIQISTTPSAEATDPASTQLAAPPPDTEEAACPVTTLVLVTVRMSTSPAVIPVRAGVSEPPVTPTLTTVFCTSQGVRFVLVALTVALALIAQEIWTTWTLVAATAAVAEIAAVMAVVPCSKPTRPWSEATALLASKPIRPLSLATAPGLP